MNGLIAVANAPGVYQAIKAGITSVLNGMMVLPKRIDIPLTDEITNEIRFRFVLANPRTRRCKQDGQSWIVPNRDFRWTLRQGLVGPCRESDH